MPSINTHVTMSVLNLKDKETSFTELLFSHSTRIGDLLNSFQSCLNVTLSTMNEEIGRNCNAACLRSRSVLYLRLSASLDGVFRGRIEIRKEMLELESSERDLAYKIYRKELMMARISLFAQGDTDAQKVWRMQIPVHNSLNLKSSTEYGALWLLQKMIKSSYVLSSTWWKICM